MLLLKRSEIENLLAIGDVIDVIEKTFADFARGYTMVPLRQIITVNEYNGSILYMPAYLPKQNSLAVKVVSVFENNKKLNLPTIFATILINDDETGMPLALMDGTLITALRTGAATAVAAKYLARKDSEIIGVIGTGYQAIYQLLALSEVLKIKDVYVYNRTRKKAEEYRKIMSGKLGVNIHVVDSARKVVDLSDVVVLATTSRTPVIKGDWLRPGMHIASIGWMGRDAREVDSKTVKISRLVVDTRDGVLSESGDIIIPIKKGVITEKHIYAEIGEIIIGKKKGRVSDDEITLWKSVGIAILDAATAKLAYEKAIKENIGTEINLF